MRRLAEGASVSARTLVSIRAEQVPVPDPRRVVHLQFRRFAGCPICNLHLRSVARRHDEIVAAGVREVVVFHSDAATMLPYQGQLPFAAIADPQRRLYTEFGVGSSPRAMRSLGALAAALRGLLTIRARPPARGESALGLPADFLIAPDGRLLAVSYGTHADDQWSVDDVLRLARTTSPPVGVQRLT